MSKRWIVVLTLWTVVFITLGAQLYAYSFNPDCVPNSECDLTKASLPAKVLMQEAIFYFVVTAIIVALGCRDRRKRRG